MGKSELKFLRLGWSEEGKSEKKVSVEQTQTGSEK
jgi:hypothetical protein